MDEYLCAEDWLKSSQETYKKNLLVLQNEYSGKFVAIDGSKIIEINSLILLERKYEQEGLPSVKIYPIPDNDEYKSIDDIFLSDPRILD